MLGLGLAVARELIQAHKGRIWVEDTPGGGATFKVSFHALKIS
jgi:two-component system, OmpR family, sensor kinase